MPIFAVKNYIAGHAPKLTKLPLFSLDINKHLKSFHQFSGVGKKRCQKLIYLSTFF